ncbi:hypothetical protein Bca4012_071830 [Brassica carinata]
MKEKKGSETCSVSETEEQRDVDMKIVGLELERMPKAETSFTKNELGPQDTNIQARASLNSRLSEFDLDYMKYKKGITRPEMIIPESGHSAYDKAAQYFSIKLWRVPVDKDFIADVKAMTRHVNRNTIIVIFVGSAPGFPHGIIDPIELPPEHKQDIEASKRLEDGFVYYKSFFKLDGPCRFDSYRFVVRKPDMTIVAFGSKALDILALECTTETQQVKANPGPITGGLAPIYGAAGKMPHRGIMVNDLLVSFMDSRY